MAFCIFATFISKDYVSLLMGIYIMFIW